MKAIVRVVLYVAVMLSVGCGVVVSTGVKAVRGVQAEVLPIRDLTPGTLAAYNTLKLGEVSSDIHPICPGNVIAEIRKAAPKQFAEETEKRFKGGPKVLQANIVVRFYKKKGLMGEGRLDLLATLVDAESGTEIGKVLIAGITESPVHTGIDDMAEKTTEKLAEYLDKKKKG